MYTSNNVATIYLQIAIQLWLFTIASYLGLGASNADIPNSGCCTNNDLATLIVTYGALKSIWVIKQRIDWIRLFSSDDAGVFEHCYNLPHWNYIAN